MSDAAKTYWSIKDALAEVTASHDGPISNACYCIGPQNGEPFCPCMMRAKNLIGPDNGTTIVQAGWKCPVCGKGNAPWASSCQNFACGIDLGKVTCEAKS